MTDDLTVGSSVEEPIVVAESSEATGESVEQSTETSVAEAKLEATTEDATETPIEESASDLFAEYDRKPRTLAEIEAAYPRWHKEAREAVAFAEDQWKKQLEISERLGGDPGIELAQDVMKFIRTTPDPSNPQVIMDAANGMLEAANANPELLKAMGGMVVDAYLNDPRTSEVFAENLVKSQWGDDLSFATVDKLVKAYQQGGVDLDNLEIEGNEPSAREKALLAKVSELQKQVGEVKGTQESELQKQTRDRYDKAIEYVSSIAVDPLIPIAEKFGWMPKDDDPPALKDAKVLLGEMWTAWINTQVAEQPAYAAVEYIAQQPNAFTPDGKPSRALSLNANPLGGWSQAKFLNAIRQLQPLIKLTRTNGNGQKAPAPVKAGPVPPLQTGNGVKPPQLSREQHQAEADAAWQRVEQARRAAQAG